MMLYYIILYVVYFGVHEFLFLEKGGKRDMICVGYTN